MIDIELVTALNAAIPLLHDTYALSDLERNSLLEKVATTFIKDKSALWWWESLSEPFESIPYGSSDPIPMIANYLGGMASKAYLVVTDDDRPPWPVICGPLDSLFAILRQTRFFEYFMADEHITSIVFDTHHNSLIVSSRERKECHAPTG